MRTRSGSLSNGVPSNSELNQSRSVGMFLQRSDYDRIQQDQFAGMSSNPAVSGRQQRFMAMCANNPGSARGRCPSHEVAEEFSHRG
jgi:hypothetical protein